MKTKNGYIGPIAEAIIVSAMATDDNGATLPTVADHLQRSRTLYNAISNTLSQVRGGLETIYDQRNPDGISTLICYQDNDHIFARVETPGFMIVEGNNGPSGHICLTNVFPETSLQLFKDRLAREGSLPLDEVCKITLPGGVSLSHLQVTEITNSTRLSSRDITITLTSDQDIRPWEDAIADVLAASHKIVRENQYKRAAA